MNVIIRRHFPQMCFKSKSIDLLKWDFFISNSLEFIQIFYRHFFTNLFYLFFYSPLKDFVKRENFTLIKIIKFKFITQSYLWVSFHSALRYGSSIRSNDLFGLERIYLGNFFYGTFDIRKVCKKKNKKKLTSFYLFFFHFFG
jgi:hypothetical protein